MSTKNEAALLKETIQYTEKLLTWLQRSLQQCHPIDIDKSQAPEDLDKFEALSARFARTVDILFQKVFRLIDTIELSEGGTLLDVLNRAEKRNLIESTQTARQLRELRNMIAHEYTETDLKHLFKHILNATPALISICQQTLVYCQQLLTRIAP